MSLISDEEWPKLFGRPVKRVSMDEKPPFDFWPYVEEIPRDDFNGYDCSEGQVEYVYRCCSGRLDHVLINSNAPNVFMVVVLDREAKLVIGHHLLDLPVLYGLRDSNSDDPGEQE